MIVNRDELERELKLANMLTLKSKSRPELSMVSLECVGDKLYISSTNLDAVFRIEIVGHHLLEEFHGFVDCKTFLQGVSGIDSTEVTLSQNRNILEVRTAEYSCSLPLTLGLNSFEIEPVGPPISRFTIDRGVLKTALDRASIAMDKGSSGYRCLDTISILGVNGNIHFVATDQARLSFENIEGSKGSHKDFKIALRRNTLKALLKACSVLKNIPEVTFEINKDVTNIRLGNTLLASRNIDVQLPTYIGASDKLKGSGNTYELNTKEFKKKLKAFSGNAGIIVDEDKKTLTLKSSDMVVSTKLEESKIENCSAGISAPYFLDYLKKCPSKKFTIHLAGAKTPIILQDGNHLYFMSPASI